MSAAKISPLPWMVSPSSMGIHHYIESRIRPGTLQEVASCGPTEGPEGCVGNAEFIVRACNAHDDLVKAAESAKVAIAGLLETDEDGHPSDRALHVARCAIGDLNVALAKAGAQ